MSLSECMKCGGHIPLGPHASNVCDKCGAGVFAFTPDYGCPLCYEHISEHLGTAKILEDTKAECDMLRCLLSRIDPAQVCAATRDIIKHLRRGSVRCMRWLGYHLTEQKTMTKADYIPVVDIRPFWRYAVGPPHGRIAAIPFYRRASAFGCYCEMMRDLPWFGCVLWKRTLNGLVRVVEYDPVPPNAQHKRRGAIEGLESHQ